MRQVNAAEFFQIVGGVLIRPKAATSGIKSVTVIGLIGRQTEKGSGGHRAGLATGE